MKTKARRRHRPNRNSLRTLDPARFSPHLPPLGLLITAVQRSAPATQVRIFFAQNITWNGSETPTAFEAFTSDGFMDGCINVLGTGPNWIEVEFNGDVAVGATWEVDALLAGVTPAVAWPQAGVVTA